MTFDHVTPGSPLRFSARKENAISDLLNQAARGGFEPLLGNQPVFNGVDMLVRNESGSVCERGSILQITGIASDPTGNENAFLEEPVLKGGTPSGDAAHACVICLEGMTAGTSPYDGRVGRARLSGACPVRVDFQKTTHRFAIPKDGETGHLISAVRGPFEILWPRPASATGEQWAVVRFPAVGVLMRRAKPDADITAGSSGTFSIYDATTDSTENVAAYYDWGTDGATLAAGTEGWISWDDDERRWEWVGGACEASS